MDAIVFHVSLESIRGGGEVDMRGMASYPLAS